MRLSCSLLLAISFKLVQDFLLLLLDVLIVFPASTFADVLAGSIDLLDANLILFVFCPSHEAVVRRITGGVAEISVMGKSMAPAPKADISILLASSLLIMLLSDLVDSCDMVFRGLESTDDFSFDGHIPFICPLGGTSLQILMRTKMALVYYIVLSDISKLLAPMIPLCSFLLNSYSAVKAWMKNSFTSVKQSMMFRVAIHNYILHTGYYGNYTYRLNEVNLGSKSN